MTDIRAQLVSMGGGIILAVTIMVTLVFIFSFLMPQGNGTQLLIIIILSIISWVYFINCATEHLKLTESELIYSSMLTRTQRIAFEDIEAYKLTDLGVQLNGSMYVLEIQHAEKKQPVEISLGPCWRRHELRQFIKTLGTILEEINT